ncbi:hypothetical protein GCM10027199_18930 [Amycolatopsis magusensis]
MLVAHVHRLDREVEHHDPGGEQPQRPRQLPDRRPRRDEQGERETGDRARSSRVRPAARARRAEGAGESGDAEQADLAFAQLPRRFRQRQGQPAPQRAERGEQEERDEPARQEEALAEQSTECAHRLPVPRGSWTLI